MHTFLSQLKIYFTSLVYLLVIVKVIGVIQINIITLELFINIVDWLKVVIYIKADRQLDYFKVLTVMLSPMYYHVQDWYA